MSDAIRNVRLSGTFRLRSPLSHIGESISTTSYLVEEPVLQRDGTLATVFCYSGNAWRGQLRDLSASYMLRYLDARVPIDAFHLLFAGGKIGGEMVVDVNRARDLRRAIPHISLFGGGISNQILAGKMAVGNCYPLCVEVAHLLPEAHREACRAEYRALTFEKSFSRKDDAKDPRLAERLSAPVAGLIEGDGRGEPKEPPEQMRMSVELLAAGTALHTEITLWDVSEIELGCLTAALHSFSAAPWIGGQRNKGHGHVELHYEIEDLDSGEQGPYLSVVDRPRLSTSAEAAKAAYDDHLRAIYEQRLTDGRDEIVALLGSAA